MKKKSNIILSEKEVAELTSKKNDETVLPSPSQSSFRQLVPVSNNHALEIQDPLRAYLNKIRVFELLKPAEEKELAVRYFEKKDPLAAKRLITSNLRLVVKIAKEYHRSWANLLDLIQEGNVGLSEAVKRYNPYKEVRFPSYAQFWIRAMILKFLLDNFRLVKLGNTRAGRKLFFQLNKEKERLLRQGLPNDNKLLAEKLDVNEKEMNIIQDQMSKPELSLSTPLNASEGRTIEDILHHADEKSPESQLSSAQTTQLIHELFLEFGNLLTNEREQSIWYERLMSDSPQSLAAIGDRFGITKERVRQIEEGIKENLKQFIQTRLGADVQFETFFDA